MEKVYLFLAEGFEEIEALTVVDMLRRAGIGIEMVSITGKEMVEGSHQIAVKADLLFEDADFSSTDMLVLPGGMPGTMNLLAHEGLINRLKEFHEQGKMLAAICAAPRILGINGILEGKHAVCYPGNEGFLAGAIVETSPVMVDGSVITSRGMGTAIQFSTAIIEHFRNKDEADKILKAIIYQ